MYGYVLIIILILILILISSGRLINWNNGQIGGGNKRIKANCGRVTETGQHVPYESLISSRAQSQLKGCRRDVCQGGFDLHSEANKIYTSLACVLKILHQSPILFQKNYSGSDHRTRAPKHSLVLPFIILQLFRSNQWPWSPTSVGHAIRCWRLDRRGTSSTITLADNHIVIITSISSRHL